MNQCFGCKQDILPKQDVHTPIKVDGEERIYHETCWAKYVCRCYHEYANALVRKGGEISRPT